MCITSFIFRDQGIFESTILPLFEFLMLAWCSSGFQSYKIIQYAKKKKNENSEKIKNPNKNMNSNRFPSDIVCIVDYVGKAFIPFKNHLIWSKYSEYLLQNRKFIKMQIQKWTLD